MPRIIQPASIDAEEKDSLGIYFREVSKESLLSKDEELELARRIQDGDMTARNELVKANLRFVVTVAKQYQGRGLLLEDLIAEGNVGLLRAAESFNPNKGFHFISYAVWWIRQAILKAIYFNASDVRLPASQIEPKQKINKISAEFERINDRPPTLGELSELTGYKEKFIQGVQLSSNTCVSFDTPCLGGEDDNSTIGDLIADTTTETPDISTNKTIITEEVNRILNNLNNRDHDIICMVFGLKGCHEMTYEEVSKKFALSSERVRQIVRDLLKAFRKDRYTNSFKNLL